MPYIEEKERAKIDPRLDYLIEGLGLLKPGELNYILSRIVWDQFDKNPSYTQGNALVGVLQCVDAEFYRRKLAPYEDQKIKENGDI